jgi:hypothetical protein
MAEQRALGDFGTSAPIVFLLTSIAWREAWKYRDRATVTACMTWVTHGSRSNWRRVPWVARFSRLDNSPMMTSGEPGA